MRPCPYGAPLVWPRRQVVLSWALAHGVSVLPASTDRERQRSNLESGRITLTPEEMASIDVPRLRA